LETSIIDDYRGFVDGLPELPEGVSFAALDEWINESVPQIELLGDVELENIHIIPAEIPLEVNEQADSMNKRKPILQYFHIPTRRFRIALFTNFY